MSGASNITGKPKPLPVQSVARSLTVVKHCKLTMPLLSNTLVLFLESKQLHTE